MRERGIKLLSLLIWLVTGLVCQGQTLHLLAFADTGDPDIGSNNMKTYTALTGDNGLAATIANYAGLKLNSVSFYGSNCTVEQLNKVLDGVVVGSDDVVLFYFVGHGFNSRHNKYPSLIFGNANADPATVDASSRNLLEIYARIRAKKPRLTLAIGDACNKERADEPLDVRTVRNIGVMPRKATSSDRYKALFRQWQGGIVMSSSQINQFSHTDAKGGWMSVSFQNALNDWCSENYKSPVTWTGLLDDVVLRTKTIAQQNNKEQVPQYVTELTPYKGTEIVVSRSIGEKTPAICPPLEHFVNEIALAGIKADMPLLKEMRTSLTSNNAEEYAEAFDQFYRNQKPFYQTLGTVLFNQITDLPSGCKQQFAQETKWLYPNMAEINERYDVIHKYVRKPNQLVQQARSELPSIISRLQEILDKLDK